LARRREKPIAQLAADLGVSDASLPAWWSRPTSTKVAEA
jgi:hypothetical protein